MSTALGGILTKQIGVLESFPLLPLAFLFPFSLLLGLGAAQLLCSRGRRRKWYLLPLDRTVRLYLQPHAYKDQRVRAAQPNTNLIVTES